MSALPRKHTHRIGLLAVSLALIAAAAACAGGSNDSGEDDRAYAANMPAGEAEMAADQDRAALDTLSKTADTAASLQDGSARQGRNRPAPTEQSIIRTGNVSLSHDDVEKAGFDIRELLDRHRGQVGSQETTTDDEGEINRLRLEVRVPSGEFEEAMVELEKLGTLRSSDSSSEDVTTQVIDTASRVRTQERSIARIQSLLAQAVNLNQVIAIESQLSNRQADLESLKAQLTYLKDQSSLSTITVNVTRTEAATPEDDEDESGFVAGLKDGWSGLGSAASGVATAAGMLLPFAALLLILGAPAWLVLRQRRNRRPITPQAE